MVTTVPIPILVDMSILPLFPSIILLVITRPSPVPFFFVEQKGLKIFCCCSSEKPFPVSSKLTSTYLWISALFLSIWFWVSFVSIASITAAHTQYPISFYCLNCILYDIGKSGNNLSFITPDKW